MPTACPDCEFENPTGFNFCGRCGKALPSATFDGDATVSIRRNRPENQPRAERRQLTVLFSDLVGSTSLSQQLDPEDLREVIRTYQRTSIPIIERLGGFVSHFMGDGIMAFFGYPRAHEDDPERGVRAGLELVDAVGRLEFEFGGGTLIHPAVRVGIATGLVIAGDRIGQGTAEEDAVVGQTPNLAARLQSLAAPNTVVIGPRTRRLVGSRFELNSLGKRAMKGFDEPLAVWQVLSSSERSTRFEALRASSITPLVNRHAEFSTLKSCWSEAESSHGQIALISGEPGIGKSRLAQALLAEIAEQPHYRLRYQCSPYHINTVLHPFIGHFERAAGIGNTDGPAEKAEKLRALLELSGRNSEESIAVFASLLGIAIPQATTFNGLTARNKKAKTFDALLEQIRGLSFKRPVLGVVEDLHWADPSSRELLERFVEEASTLRVLLLVTYRPGTHIPWRQLEHVTTLSLSKLNSPESTDIVRIVAGAQKLSERVVRRIVEKTDGVPLFVEELTKTLLQSSPDDNASGPASHVDDESAIPETLHDSLMARLDQLPLGKHVAQIGATIGRQFGHPLLCAVAGESEDALQTGLEQLTNSGLVFATGTPPHAEYTFKHALVRDTAYASLLRGELRTLHKRIADWLREHEPSTPPELLARHYMEAGLNKEAIAYWLAAGRQASGSSAYAEAVNHLNQGLELLRNKPGTDTDARSELEFLVSLGPPLISTRGSGSDVVEQVYRRAVELAERLPQTEEHFAALWGWWRISKNFITKSERAQKLQVLADQLDDDGLRLQAHHCQWATLFHLADHRASRQHIQAGLALYDRQDYRSHASRYAGHDPKVCALGEAAQALWLSGFPERALATMKQAREWAHALDQAGSLVHVMDMNLLLMHYRRDANAVAQQAEELTAYAKEQQFVEYEAKAQVFRGWAIAKLGDTDAGIRLMYEGITSHGTIGTKEDPPVWLVMLAEGYLQCADIDKGLATIEEAFQHINDSGLKFWRAELFRCKGELLQLSADGQHACAVECMEQAIEIAQQQQAKSLELRASVALSRVYSEQGMQLRAHEVLAPVFDWFVEGFETADLAQAKALLNNLSAADGAREINR